LNFLKSHPSVICYAQIDIKLADIYIRDGYDNGLNVPKTSAVEPIGETDIALTGMATAVPDPTATTGVSVKFGTDETEYSVTARTLGAGTDEVQTVEIDDDVSGGTFLLNFGGYNTNAIAYNAANTVVEAELEALNSVGSGNVAVTGSSPKWTVTFQGDLAATDVALMTGDGSLLTGGVLTDVGITETVKGVTGVNEVQSITKDGTVSGGTFTVSFGGDTTPAIAYDATAGEIELNLETLDSIPQGECTVAGGPISTDPVTLTFSGTLGKQNLAEITVASGSLTGGGTYEPATDTPGVAAVNEVNTVSINDSTTGGTFTLTHSANETAPILYNASAADIDTALEALASIGAGDVVVTGGPGPATDWVVTFQGTLAGSDETLTGTGTNLTGGSATAVSVTEITKGVTDNETTQISITPALVVATTINGDVTFGGRKLEIKVGEGNLTFTENTPREYKRNRGRLDTVRNADEEPVDVSFDFVWEFLSAVAGSATPTIKEALKQSGEAEDWLSTSSDACEPYCCDIEVNYDPACGGANTELILLEQFRQENLEHNLSDGQISCTGKCNVTEATSTRGA